MRRCTVVLVDDEPSFLQLFGRHVVRLGRGRGLEVRLERAATFAQGLGLVPLAGAGAGWIVDQGLPDGTGLALIARLHEVGAAGPKLLLTGAPSVALAAQAACYRVPFADKPCSEQAVVALLEAVAGGQRADARPPLHAAETAAALSEALDLSPAEARVALLCCEGVDPLSQLHVLEVSHATLKSHRRSILRKARARGLADESIDRLLLDWLRRSGDPT